MTMTAPALENALDHPMMLRPFVVTDRIRETDDTVTLLLAAADGGESLRFAPGQFTMMYVYGVGEVPLSISGDPERPEVLVHTIRAVGAVTDAICDLLPDDTVGIRGPYGTPWPISESTGRDIVVIAGGIGLAPVRPVIYHTLAHRDEYASVSIVYGSRSPDDLLYTEDVHAWKARFDTNVQITVDRGDAGWLGDVGVVTPLLNRLAFAPENTTAIVCGPEIMMRVVAKDLVQRGVRAGDVHVSLERNLKCGLGYCGHCQIGAAFVCKDGPVVPYVQVAHRLGLEEL